MFEIHEDVDIIGVSNGDNYVLVTVAKGLDFFVYEFGLKDGKIRVVQNEKEAL